MKTQPIKVTATQPAKNFLGILATSIRTLLVALSLLVATSTPVLAVDAVWLLNPGSGDWNTGTNWSTSPSTPVSPGDTATFNTSTQTSLTLSSGTTVESITFQPGASAFTISTNGNVLVVQGAGIVNNSGSTQAIINTVTGFTSVGSTEFHNTSTAGNATITNNSGFDFKGGVTKFFNTSTAGNATITNSGASFISYGGGVTEFFNASTAGNATINNNGGNTEFFDTSTAGSATINNTGGFTEFLNTSTAGNATIVNNGGSTSFANASTAGNATIITNGGTVGGSGGRTFFSGNSDGGTARAITNGNGSFDISNLTSSGMEIGSIEGSGNYFLGSKTLSVGGNNLSTTVSGVIQDGGLFSTGGTGGSLTKLGTGMLTLTGTNTYIGTTTVDRGSLIVDGSIASVQTVVNPGGFLGGHGIIGGNLVNSGVVGQINSPGTLKLAGNYTQNPGGTLRIGVSGVAPAQHDLLAVNGHATLGGTLQLFSLGGFHLQPGEQITFLTAKNGVSGTFSNTQNGLISTGTIVQGQITSLTNAVVLETTQGSFANTPGVATTPNELAVAKALDSARGDPREAALFAFLNSQPLANLPHDLNLIAPTQITSINATAVSVGRVQVSNVGQRLANIRGGSTGFSSAGFSLTGGATNFGEGFAGVSGPEGKSGPAVFAPTPENRWGVFVTGLGEFTNVDSTPNAAGYDVNTGGFTFGVDYRLAPNFALASLAAMPTRASGLMAGETSMSTVVNSASMLPCLRMVSIWIRQ